MDFTLLSLYSMKALSIILTVLFTICLAPQGGSAQSNELLFEPITVINNSDKSFQVLSSPDPAMGYTDMPYQISYLGKKYDVRSSFMTVPANIDTLKKEINNQVLTNPNITLFDEFDYKGYYGVSFRSQVISDEGSASDYFIEFASTTVGAFFITVEAVRESQDQLDLEKLKEIINHISFISLAEMDRRLGLPLREKDFLNELEQIQLGKSQKSIEQLQHLYDSGFSYSIFYNNYGKLERGEFGLNEIANFIFEKNPMDDLGQFRGMFTQPIDYYTFEFMFPNARNKFIEEFATSILSSNQSMVDVVLLNPASTYFEVTYVDAQDPEEMKTMVALLTKQDRIWSLQPLQLPKTLAEDRLLQGTYELRSDHEGFLYIYSPVESKYYFKLSTDKSNNWEEYSVLPYISKSAFLVLYLNAQIDDNLMMNNSDLYCLPESEHSSGLVNQIYKKLDQQALVSTLELPDPVSQSYRNISSSNYYFSPFTYTFDYLFEHEAKVTGGPNTMAFSSPLLFTDLDKDGFTEVTHYIVSNGKLIHAQSKEVAGNSLVPLNENILLKELEKDIDCYNLKIYSQFKFK
jgi:hypothetical protein